MYSLKKKTRGAVSVFLTLILVPCIVVTSLFVDAGRIVTSKSMATSAADLALDSLLTNYDADLNEWYGMVASCQTIEDFYEVSAGYFLRTISSQGLDDDEILLLSDYYADATSDDTIYDLLRVESQTETSAMITEVNNANLTNATFIKEQTLEFMKYRAPITLVSGLIERLSSSDSGLTGATQADDNEDLVDKKQDFYEAEGELYSASYKSYCALYEYYESVDNNGMSLSKLQEYADQLNTYEEAYESIHNLMVSNLYNTSGLSTYSRVTKSLTAYISDSNCTSTSSNVYSSRTRESGSYVYYITESKAEDLLDDLEVKAQAFETALNDFVQAADDASLLSTMPGSGDSDAYGIQWWAKMNTAVNSSNGKTAQLKTAAENLLKAYAKVINMEDCILVLDSTDEDDSEEEEETEDTEDSEDHSDNAENWQSFYDSYVYEDTDGTELYDYDELLTRVTNLQSKYLTAGKTDSSDNYLVLVNELEAVSSENVDNIKSSSLMVTIDGVNKTIDDAIPYLQQKISAIRSELNGYVTQLDTVIDGNDDEDVQSLDSLITLLNKYQSTLNSWSNEADEADTDMKTDDQEEIETLETEIADSMTKENIQALKARLENIRTQYKNVISTIDSMKYGSKKVVNISTYSTFKSQASGKVSSSDIPLQNGDLKSYQSSTFSQLFSSSVDSLSIATDDDHNPVINPRNGSVATPELFVKWYDIFGEPDDTVTSELEKAEDEEGDAKDESDSEEDDAKNKGRYHGGGSDITADFSTDSGTFSFTDSALNGIVELMQSIVDLDLTNMRDDLYVTTYMMEMLSYATYENEGYYSLLSDTEKTSLTLNTYEDVYKEHEGSESEAGTWLSTSTTDTYNKSLTNKMINSSNNAAFEAEVEYILYGGTNEENVKSAYSTIYGIRYILNLISGFANFWSVAGQPTENGTAYAIDFVAEMISMATSYIVPAAVVKVVLIPILTVFETSRDLDRLEAGFPVEIYKTSYTNWWIGFSNDGSASYSEIMPPTGSNRSNEDKGIFYSDYLFLFVYLGLENDSSAEGMYLRMAEVIQANMRKVTNTSTYSMKKARLYFQLKATLRVEPLMITLPYFNGYDNNLQTNTDWCTYEITIVRGY